MNGWRFAVVTAVCLTVAIPSGVRAQRAPDDPPTVNVSAVANGQPVPAESPSSTPVAAPSVAPAPDPAALPAWPPPGVSKKLFARFTDDLTKPLSSEQKFKRAMVEILFPGTVFSAAAAGISMASNTDLDKDYGMGGKGFVRRWGSAFGQDAVSVFMGDFVLASAFHQDPRYHPSPKNGFGRRLGWAISRAVVTQSDTGNTQFNASGVLGAAMGAVAAQGWHHSSDQKGSYYAERFGYAELVTVGFNVVREFFFYKDAPRK